MVRDFQSRLDMKHSIIKRKVLDNQIGLAGNVTDSIRVQVKLNDEGDVDSRIISKADIISVIWPPLKEIPIRKIHKNKPDGYIDESVGSYTITSLFGMAEDGENEKMFKLYFQHGADINEGDYIVRVFLDPDVKEPIILVVKVSQILGTFSHSMLLWETANCVLDVEDIPKKIQDIIGQMAERRLHIKF